MSFNQNDYIKEFNRNTYKMYQFRVRKDNKKLIRYLNNKEERNSYILSLIDKDMHKKKILSLKQIKDIIKPILNKYGINDIYLFGSYARGEADQNSDIDIYCEKGKIRTLFDQNSLEEELEKALKKKVDIVFDTSVMDSYFEQQLREDLIKLC